MYNLQIEFACNIERIRKSDNEKEMISFLNN